MSSSLSFGEIRGVRIRIPIDRVERRAWPILACTAAMPLMFFAGLQGVVWMAPGVVFSWRLIRRPTTNVPRSALVLGLALVWMLASFVQVKLGSIPLSIYRWSLFLGAFASEVYLVNEDEDSLPTERVVQWLGALFVAMVVFGYMAIIAPIDAKSPLLIALGPIGRIEFIKSISGWNMAEVQGFLGFPLPRPAAPFPAANGWGSAAGLLFPFFVSTWLVDARGGRRIVGAVIGVLALVPIVVSFNRGLWMSMVLAMAYLALRRMLAGRIGTLMVVLLAGVMVGILFVVTPLGALAQEKVDTAGDSNNARSSLYDEGWNGAKESPLIGNGAPKRVDPKLPPVGTHGMIWYLLYVHGFVVAGLYVLWLGLEVIRSAPSRSPGSVWFHIVLVVAAFQTMVYGMLPQVVLVGIVAGLARRAERNYSGRTRSIAANPVRPLEEPRFPVDAKVAQ